MSTGYECRNCGREPDPEELSGGSCPGCSSTRSHVWRTLPGQLEALPRGSSLQVLVRRYRPPCSGWPGDHVTETLFLWTLVERDSAGKAVWRSHLGRTSFVDALGLDRPVYVQRYAETRFHDPLRMTSEAVAHFTTGEMTYGAWHVVHDLTPTARVLTLQRMMVDMDWPPPELARL